MGRGVERPQVVARVNDGQEMLLSRKEDGMATFPPSVVWGGVVCWDQGLYIQVLDHLERGQTLELAKLQ